MSYVRVTRKIEFDFPGSTSLYKGYFDEEEAVIGIAYHSNREFYYEHNGCRQEDLDELLELVDLHCSAGTGYADWKDIRKRRLEDADRRQFDQLWESLNEHQQQNFSAWFQEKIKERYPHYNTPIYLRMPKQRAPRNSW